MLYKILTNLKFQWGRPGGGAPTVDRRRHETHEILESPRYPWDQNMDQTSYSAPGN